VGVSVGMVVGVIVTVLVDTGVGGVTDPVARRAKNVMIAPIAKTRINKPSAMGRLRVISGNRGSLTPDVFVLLGAAGWTRFRPHTEHLVAVSLTREPQVGHNFCGFCLLISFIALFSLIQKVS
jgi:hypothetical protein